MKTRLIYALLLSASFIHTSVSAAMNKPDINGNRTSVYLGYQHGELKDFGALDGANLKLHYETEYPLGIMASVSAMKNSWGKGLFKRGKDKTAADKEAPHRSAEYYSAMAGPTFRLNDSVSLYALTGLAHTKVKLPSKGEVQTGDSVNASNKFAYGFGMIANVTDNLSLTVGYEGSKAMFDEKAHSINGILVSAGYRF
jgi:putative virulence related protein PagC